MLLRFTNLSKWYTFNVRLVPDKNSRTIAPTVFLVGTSTNLLKNLSTVTHIFLKFTVNGTKFCGDAKEKMQGLGTLKLVYKNIVAHTFVVWSKEE